MVGPVACYYSVISIFTFCVLTLFVGGCYYLGVEVVDFESGFGGIGSLYDGGGWSLLIVGAGLLMTLFVVLQLVRGISFSVFKG